MATTIVKGTENLLTVAEFAKEKNVIRAYVYNFIEAGLIEYTYIGKNAHGFIDAKKYKKLKLRYLSSKDIKQIKEANNN